MLNLKEKVDRKTKQVDCMVHYTSRAVVRALIGVCIFIYSCYARLISFEINPNNNWSQKKLVGHNTNIWIYTPPPINALATALITRRLIPTSTSKERSNHPPCVEKMYHKGIYRQSTGAVWIVFVVNGFNRYIYIYIYIQEYIWKKAKEKREKIKQDNTDEEK